MLSSSSFKSSLEDMFIDLEKFIDLFLREGKGWGGEEHQQVASGACPSTNGTHNLGMCPDQGQNLQPFGRHSNHEPPGYGYTSYI